LDAPHGLTDLEKSAVVMLSIGEDAAAEVMKYMTQLEINLLSLAMARVSNVSKGEVTAVFQQFIDAMLDETSIGIGASGYVQGVLERALGTERAERLVGRLNQGDYFAGIEAVQMQDPRVLAEMIKNEHPQIVAMIFAYLEPDQADALIQFLPAELIEQMLPRLATLDSIPNAAVRELNDVIEDMLAGESEEARVNVGGVGMAAKILNRFDAPRAEAVLKQISEIDEDLAQRIQNSMFTSRIWRNSTIATSRCCCARSTRSSWPRRSRAPMQNCSTRPCATCRNARPRCCARKSRRAARCGSPKSMRQNARSLRPRNVWSARARSSWRPTRATW
jgi:flagellar motor switch protein FliG